MSESRRGCGYRQIGGLYLICDPGFTLVCDGLPLELEPCGCCGFEPPFSRNLQHLNPQYVIQAELEHHGKHGGSCSCPVGCPICRADMQPIFGLMFVSKKFYTPHSLIQEAKQLGICKKIPMISRWLIMGETWILLAHNAVPKVSLEELKSGGIYKKEPEKMRAIFYAFKPQRIEMPVWNNEISFEEIQLLEKKGITPVLLDPTPEARKRHGRAKNRKVLLRLLQPEKEEADE